MIMTEAARWANAVARSHRPSEAGRGLAARTSTARSDTAWAWLVVAGVLLGCGDRARVIDLRDAAEPVAGGAGATTSADPTGSERKPGPLYLVSNTVFGPDSSTSYLTVVDSLAAGEPVDRSAYVELPGSARAYGPEEGDVVYVTSSEAGTMTEVTFEPDGSARLGRSVSFANLGIDTTSGGNVNYHVSPTKAYFVSQQALTIVVWNPQEMEIVATVPLEISLDPSFPDVVFHQQPILSGDRLILVSSNYGDIPGPGTTVTVVDVSQDRILSTTLEPRCQAMLQSSVDGQGDRYFASSSYLAGMHFLLPDQAPAPCMLRIRAGETSFDPDWSRTLDEDLSTGIWTGVTPAASGSIHVQGIAEDMPAVTQAMEAYEVSNARPWTWYSMSDGDSAPVRSETGLSNPPLFGAMTVGEEAYVTVWDDVDTTLVDLTSSELPRPGLVVPGFVYNVVKIR